MKASDLIMELVKVGAAGGPIAEAAHDALKRGAALRDQLEPEDPVKRKQCEAAKQPYKRSRGFFTTADVNAAANSSLKLLG